MSKMTSLCQELNLIASSLLWFHEIFVGQENRALLCKDSLISRNFPISKKFKLTNFLQNQKKKKQYEDLMLSLISRNFFRTIENYLLVSWYDTIIYIR